MAATKPPSIIAEELLSIVEDIFANSAMPKKLSEVIVKYFANQLFKKTEEGFGGTISSIDYNTPDYKMLENLQKNIYQFSAAKNYSQLKSLTQALVNNDGKLRTRSEFFAEAFKINDEHVITWLDTERNTAIASAQMASKWVDIQANKTDLPLLMFDAIIDGSTTEICEPLNGTILPVDDDFWNTYYPPNHYNCRSTVRQLSEGEVTKSNAIIYPEKIPVMFQTNTAKDGVIFPKDHPYFIGTPAHILKEGQKLIDE